LCSEEYMYNPLIFRALDNSEKNFGNYVKLAV